MLAKLTKRIVDETAPSEKAAFIWDSALQGFGLKVTPAGRKVFIFQYRPGGRGTPTKRVTLGRCGALTVEQARTLARRLSGVVAEGRDPRAEARQAEAAAQAEANNTFETLVDAFIKEHAKAKQKRWQETQRLLRRDAVPTWGARPASSITKQEINQLLQSVRQRAPITANRLFAALRKLFNWASNSTGRLEASPMEGMSPPSSEVSRDRVLGDEELTKLWESAGAKGYPWGPFLKLLVLTAQREDQVAAMRWSEIDGDTWNIPVAREKNSIPHVVHLSPPALAELESISRRSDTDLVFTTTGHTPISGFSKAKAWFDSHAGVTGWRFHDIRRTVTTGIANLGHPPHIADKILNHVSGTISGVAAVYQKAEFLEERKKALDDWAAHVGGLAPATTNLP